MPHALANKNPDGGVEFQWSAALDGITIMRYAHMYRERTSGGVEQYLRLLNRSLLERHSATILQMHLVRDCGCEAVEEEKIGRGRLLWVPVPLQRIDSRTTGLAGGIIDAYCRLRQWRREASSAQSGPAFPPVGRLTCHWGALLRYRWAVLSDRLLYLLQKHRVDLLALHWITYDADALISNAATAGIPFVLINHFENARFERPQMQKWIGKAAAVGGVSNRGVPACLRSRFVSLYDAVDTEFFAPEKARPSCRPAHPTILLPARVGAGKGHRDLIAAGCILRSAEADFVLCFAGALESESLHQELRRAVVDQGLEGRVRFLGEVSAEEMRDLYAQSSVVVLPSYSEGLPRVLLEAQAMEKPVVAYNCGGTGEALLPNETGFLVDKGNIEDLASKAGLLLRDKGRRLRMGVRGRKFVARQFGVPALVERHERFYLSALSAAPARRV